MENIEVIINNEDPSDDVCSSYTESLITEGNIHMLNFNEEVSHFHINDHFNNLRVNSKEDSRINKITEGFENMLCTKLIINKDSNMLILKPYFCYEILFQLKNISSVNTKLEIIEKLTWLINKIHSNAFIITNKSTLKDAHTERSVNFMNELIDILVENNRENVFSEKMLNFIEKVIFLSGLKAKYVKHVLEKMAELFEPSQYDVNKFILILKLLNRMFQKTIHDGKKFPERYFFFNNTNAHMRVDTENLQYKNISIVKGYTVAMWIRVEHVNLDSSNKRIIDGSMLYYIQTSKNLAFEVYLKNKSIYYRIVNDINNPSDKESPTHHVMDIEYGKWTMLVFSHKPWSFLQKSEFTVFRDGIENIQVKNVEYPNLKGQKLMSVGFFKDFTGQVSNVFMMNETIFNHNTIKDFSHFNFGFYNERNIRIFKDVLERETSNSKYQSEMKQTFESMLFIYSPCRVNNNIVSDILDNINAEIITSIEGNILVGGVAYDNNYYTNISFFGGINIFLPIFEFFMSPCFNSTNVLEEALNLLNTVIEKREIYNSSKNMKETKFFNYLGSFFENYDKSLFSREIMQKLLKMVDLLTKTEASPIIAKEFFRYILFNAKIFTKFDVYLQIELWKNICDVYLKRISIMNSYFDAKDIFDIIIKVYDSDINVYCCEEHLKMLCEKYDPKDSNSNQVLISNPSLLSKVSYLMIMLEGILTTNRIIASDQLKNIIPFLAYEISPCTQKNFLLILQKILSNNPQINFSTDLDNHLNAPNRKQSNQSHYNQLSYNPLQTLDESTRNKYIMTFIKSKGLEHILFISGISTLDVRLECIKLIDLFTRTKIGTLPVHIEEELIPFVVHSVFPLRTPLKTSHSNTMSNLIPDFHNNNSLGNTNEFFENRDAKLIKGGNNTKIKETIVPDFEERVNLLDRLNIEHITPDERKNSEKSEIMKDIMKLNIKKSVMKIRKNSDRELNKELIFNNREMNFHQSRNSLFMVEDDYWRMMINSNLIKKLNIPDSYVREYSNTLNDAHVEMLYDYLFKWLINRNEFPNDDDSDDILFTPALNILMKVTMHANIINKQKILSDLLMLTVYNKQNCFILIKNKYFYQWLLDLIFPFQILMLETFDDIKFSGLAATIIELGVKIHTNVIFNSILHEQEAISKSNESLIGNEGKKDTRFDHSLIFQFLLTWFYKIRKVGSIEGKAAGNMLRSLLLNLVNCFQDHLKLMSPSHRFPVWQNFLNLTLIIYEFVVFSNFDKKILEKKINFDQLEKNEIVVEVIQNLSYDFEGGENQNFSNSTSNFNSEQIKNGVSMMDIWIDRELLIKLYDCYKVIWQENVFKLEKKSASTLSDELKFVESLANKLIFENKQNFFIEDLKLLLTSSSTDNMSFDHARTNNIMRAILNIIVIIIRLSENKNEVFFWVKELEKFTLFIISATENAKIDVNYHVGESMLTYAQDATSQSILIVFNFLIDELNSPRRREFSDELIEVFKSTLRFLFIYLTNVLEKVNLAIESDSKKKSSLIFGYLKNIKNVFFVTPNYSSYIYSPCWKLYTEFLQDKSKARIFSIEEIKEYKLNKYVDIPERFNTETWIYAFQENNTSFKIIKDQFNFSYFEKLIRTRMVEAENIILNNEICFKEKTIVNKVFRLISVAVKESLFTVENKFKSSIYEYFINRKNLEYEWKYLKKDMFQWRGKWCSLDKFLKLSHNKKIKYKVANHLTSSISKPILFSIFDVENYLPKFSKFDPISGSLFNDNDSIFTLNAINSPYQSRKNLNICNNVLNSSDSDIEHSNFELKVKPITNKSIMHYKNSEYSDFIEKYSDIEKLVKYFQLFYNFNYNKNILNISEMFVNLFKQEKQEHPEIVFETCMVKVTTHKKGKLVINNKEIFFIKHIRNINNEKDNEKCVESLFINSSHSEKLGEKLVLNIKMSNVKQVYKRRLFYKKTAAEVFTFSNKSYYFNFNSQLERDNFCKAVYENSNIKDNPYLFEYHLDIKKNSAVVSKLIEEWANWRISNFDLLINMNNLGGRSYHDLTQYPIFPWIIAEYKQSNLKVDNLNNFRDLSKPIGAQGSEERVEMFKMTFKESSTANEGMVTEGNYFYNSHYSNPFYVTNFLARLFPYSNCAIELQGEGFDNPQRQFLSIQTAFNNSMTQATDIRELLPEFYYLPEMFSNLNNVNFGKIDSLIVDNVELPVWSKDPFRFIITNRTFLESEQVSSKINEWIDLIFGTKQKGKEAENAMNLFWKFTYEDEIDIDQIMKTNSDEYHSYIAKIYFGQTPSQVLTKPHIGKINKELTKNSKLFLENRKNLRVYNSTSEAKNQYKSAKKDIKNKMIVKIKSLENDKLICVYNNGVIQIMKVDDTPYTLSRFIFIKEKEVIIPENSINVNYINSNQDDIVRRISDLDETITKDINLNQPVKILKNGKIVIKGGYYDGKFLIFNVTNEESIYIPTDDDSKVTVIESDEIERTLFIGTSSGRIYTYEINDSNLNSLLHFLTLKTVLTDHEHFVNYIFVCNRLNVIATVAKDKTCNLYTYPLTRLFRVIKQETFSFDYVFLSINPLPSVILYSKTTMMFYCYSLNGNLLHTEADGVKYIFSPLIMTDAFQRDHLVYGTQYGDLLIRPLPLLSQSWKIELNKTNEKASCGLPIKCFDLSRDKRSIYFWQLEDFNISVIRDPKESKKGKKVVDENQSKNQLSTFLEKTLFDTK